MHDAFPHPRQEPPMAPARAGRRGVSPYWLGLGCAVAALVALLVVPTDAARGGAVEAGAVAQDAVTGK